jgi:hypothetical protein
MLQSLFSDSAAIGQVEQARYVSPADDARRPRRPRNVAGLRSPLFELFIVRFWARQLQSFTLQGKKGEGVLDFPTANLHGI